MPLVPYPHHLEPFEYMPVMLYMMPLCRLGVRRGQMSRQHIGPCLLPRTFPLTIAVMLMARFCKYMEVYLQLGERRMAIQSKVPVQEEGGSLGLISIA
jgi:hypothetical protein